jgi:cyclophilin family peptidyl-prolyl cis-trans isomerase/protein-disulfide isomerase
VQVRVSWRLAVILAAGVLVSCAPAQHMVPTSTEGAQPTAAALPAASCSTVEAPPTPTPASQSLALTGSDHVRGPGGAAVTLLWYCDFQSAECEIFNRVADKLEADHPTDLRIVLRPFPVPIELVPGLDKSSLATQAVLAADKQGKFWEMRDLLHKQFADWNQLSPRVFEDWLRKYAPTLGLDSKQFGADLDSAGIKADAETLYSAASSLGIAAIPTVFINGRLQDRAALSYAGLESTVALTALGARQFRSCPPFEINPARSYTATLQTEKGNIVIELLADRAPMAVNSFVFLARHGWFDGVTFHRVIPGFVAQAGDPSGTGRGGPGYVFDNEIQANLLFDRPGVVGMANSGPDTNGSQFFITYAAQPQLDGGYTIFGKVTSGMEVVESLTPRDPQATPDAPLGDKITSVSIEEH